MNRFFLLLLLAIGATAQVSAQDKPKVDKVTQCQLNLDKASAKVSAIVEGIEKSQEMEAEGVSLLKSSKSERKALAKQVKQLTKQLAKSKKKA